MFYLPVLSSPLTKIDVPQNNRGTMGELQSKVDALEHAGVFAKAEQVDDHAESLMTQFPSGSPVAVPKL